jgi:uncharacterized protein (DUF169 family)
LVLTADNLDCPGARRSFGWAHPHDAKLLEKMTEQIGISEDRVRALLDQTPHLNSRTVAVLVGSSEKPDVLISYAQPILIMELLRHFQKLTSENFQIDLSSIHSVCAHVTVKSYLSGRICLSFGCGDAREYGSIPRDRLAVGVPYQMARSLSEALDHELR